MQIRSILVTTDLSEESLRPFAPLASLITGSHSRVTLLHVVEDVPMIPHGAPMAPPMHSPSTDEDQAEAEAWLASHASRLPSGFVTSIDVVRARNVPQAIAEYARTHEVDLIAMSSHGRTGFRHLVLGSVSEAVIRHADRPVLVFPRGE
ncbi:MAG TPA: universal stress protein [Gemmatimonadales bacterium]|nr:universal stress protein [Gemmatimonadales bacterium]